MSHLPDYLYVGKHRAPSHPTARRVVAGSLLTGSAFLAVTPTAGADELVGVEMTTTVYSLDAADIKATPTVKLKFDSAETTAPDVREDDEGKGKFGKSSRKGEPVEAQVADKDLSVRKISASFTRPALDYKALGGAEMTTATMMDSISQMQQRLEAEEEAARPKVVKPAEGVFTSGYGPRWGTLHAGIDIAAPVGTPILAVMDGTVIDSGPAPGYGNWIQIRHDDGAVSVYGHMETLAVSVGERVTAGQYIAGMGSRGFSTGSHLHFEIHPTGTGAVDPVPWFAERGITIR